MTIAPSILAKYVNDIAFAAEKQPAQTPQEFLTQLEKAAYNLGTLAQINGAENLETAATYLSDAIKSAGPERRVLLNKAVGYLASTADMVGEYRDMVGD